MGVRLTQEEIQNCVCSLSNDLYEIFERFAECYPNITVPDVQDILRQASEEVVGLWIEAADDPRGDAELDYNPN